MSYNKYTITIDGDYIPSVPIAAKKLGINTAALQRRLQRGKNYLNEVINTKHIIITIFNKD